MLLLSPLLDELGELPLGGGLPLGWLCEGLLGGVWALLSELGLDVGELGLGVELELGGELDVGGAGGCGVVGLLALGQPLSTKQAQLSAATLISCAGSVPLSPIARVISPNHFLSDHRLTVFKARPKAGFAQFAH